MQKIVETGLKLDLHIHSSASSKKDGNKVKNNTLDNIPVLIEKLNENGVNICAITDHDIFSYDMFSALKKAETSGLSIKKVLPGVEFSVRFLDKEEKERVVHVVSIFNDSDISKIPNIEKVLKENPTDKSQSYSEEDFLRILKLIDLDTILIAHQKNTLSSSKTRKDDANSLGENKFLEFVYSDYFEAFEFKNRKNEVLNKNYLSQMDLQEKVHFVTGSDCHDWSVYPKEDKSDCNTIDFPYTYAKCLPSFRGLVMAMTDHSRLKLTNSFFNVDKYILDEIKIHQNKRQITIPLSKGINVIIGDNSVGKSMLLHALVGYSKAGTSLPPKVKTGYQSYLSGLGLKIDKQIDKDNIFCFDMQGEVRTKFETGNFDSSKFLSGHFPTDVDASPYMAILSSEVDRMIQYLEKKFQLDDSYKKLGKFKIHFSEGTPESLIFEKNLRSTKSKTEGIDKIIVAIKNLCIEYTKLLELQLDADDKALVMEQKEVLLQMQEKYSNILDGVNTENEKIELVAKAIDNISVAHNRNISDNQKRESAFSEKTNALKASLSDLIISAKQLETFEPHIEPTNIEVKSNKVHDYEFISKLGISEINTEYFNFCLGSILKRGSKIKWGEITEQKLKSMLLRFDEEKSVLSFIKEALIAKFTEDLKTQHSIINQGIDKYEELSSGMNSKIYFDLLTYETHRDGIYIIDQPEDNVSQRSIKSQLLDSFKYMGENRQVIMVTHNPQFIVNLDVDNIIFISKNNNKLEIQSGALEYECSDYRMLDIVANNIDGGLDSIQKRWKRYEKTVNL